MQPMNLTQVANTLAEHPTRIQNWITRNYFQPPMFARGGKREWTPAEVLRLAVFVTLVNRWGVSPAVAGRMTVVPMMADESCDLFVAWHTFQNSNDIEPVVDFIKRENLGRFLSGEVYDSQGHTPKYVDPQLLPASAIVIDPVPIIHALREAWKAELLDWD
mgnify:CR=1 FL=1